MADPQASGQEFPRKSLALRDFFHRHVARKPSSAKDAEAYRLLVSGIAGYAIFMLDPEGKVTSWNAGARQIKGYEPGEIIGRHFSCFYSLEDRAEGKPQRLLQAASVHGSAHYEGWRIRKDGSRFWASVLLTRLTDEAGALIGYSKITRDLTERHGLQQALAQSEERLRRHGEALQATLQRMQEAMAMACHELRNPLVPIQLAAALLARKHTDPDTKDLLQTVEGQSALLARLVDDLVEATQTGRASLSLQRERVSLRDVLHRAVEAARPEMQRREHRLLAGSVREDVVLFADPARLFQVFVNLLNNAARYTPNGGWIRTFVDVRPGEVVVRVEDNGYGIAAENLQRIFEPFTRGASADEIAPEGMGLGLAVVQRVVHMHEGQVVAESSGLGQGSRFSVTLPRSPERLPAPVLADDATQAHRPLRILCVDDNELVAKSLVQLLRAMGHQAERAHDGAAALRLAPAWNPDLVLMDLSMPGMDGIEVGTKLLDLMQPSPPTLVALTGWAPEDEGHSTFDAGFHCYVMKPVTVEAMEGVIALARRRLG